MLAAGAFPLLLSGCDAEAVELVQEIQAARQDCSREELRASAEDCVRMMEEYAGMGTELVHTYLGGLRALDVALDRMPPPDFDSGEMGYALSPEFRQGDAAGSGGSPRLAPSQPAYGYGGASPSRSRGQGADAPHGNGTADRYGREDPRGSYGWRDRNDRYDASGRYGPARAHERYDAYGRAGRPDGYRSYRTDERWRRADPRSGDARERSLRREALEDLRWFGLPGYGRSDGLWLLDPYAGAGGYRPYGYGGYDRYGYGAYTPYGYRGFHPYGYGSYPPYGFGGYDPYGYGAYTPYGFGGYDPYDRAGGGSYDEAPYAEPPADDSDAGRTPAEEWGYEPERTPAADGYPSPAADGASRGAGMPTGAQVGADHPAPQRPGILLPPEQRLRRPWLDD